MMRIVVPYLSGRLREETSIALQDCDVEFRPLVGDEGYYELLAELWDRGETVGVVEQDIVPWPGALDELAGCSHEWCSFPYPYLSAGTHYAGLGCTKFAGSLMRRLPRLVESIADWQDADHPPRHWCRLDGWLQVRLRQAGVQQHLHSPFVGHLGGLAPAHGCPVA